MIEVQDNSPQTENPPKPGGNEILQDEDTIQSIEIQDQGDDMGESDIKQQDLDMMRLALGSEEHLKYSERTFQINNSMSSPGANNEKFNNSATEFDQNPSESQNSQTLFTRHPFKEFT